MRNNDKEFDSLVRSVLENAEEPVPPHVLDGVFAQLDNMGSAGNERRKRLFPVWLKWGAACASAAAVVAVSVVLWPDGSGVQVAGPEVTAEVTSPVRGNSGTEVPVEIVKDTEASAEPQHQAATATGKSYIAAVLPDRGNIGEKENVPEEPEPCPETDVTETFVHIPEEEVPGGTDASGETNAAVVPEDTEDKYGTGEAFAGAWDDGEENPDSKISFVVGGDVSSNGNPNSINRSGAFRAPMSGKVDKTWIEQTSKESSYSIPVSIGVGVKIDLGKHWSVGTGLNYSMLQRTFAGKYTRIEGGKTVKSINTDIRHQVHYIGIPVNAFYDVIDSRRVKLYAYAGGTVEKGLVNIYRVKDSPRTISYREDVSGVQLSAGAGFGVEFMLGEQLGLYLDPGFRYYFDCGQPVSIRTQQPFMMNFEVGLRVAL